MDILPWTPVKAYAIRDANLENDRLHKSVLGVPWVNTIARGPLDDKGYHVNFGNKFVAVVTWDDQGVKADGFITYSQSTDPASPHFSGFTREYSAKRWKRLPFHATEIEADKISSIRLTE